MIGLLLLVVHNQLRSFIHKIIYRIKFQTTEVDTFVVLEIFTVSSDQWGQMKELVGEPWERGEALGSKRGSGLNLKWALEKVEALDFV